MKLRTSILLLPLVSFAADGQPATATAGPDPVLQLSPFEVAADKEESYFASNTLAGTRLNTPVKDLGASITVVTRQFIEDLGANNINDLLIYTAGTEAAGPGGNFSGAATDINGNQTVGEAPRNNPQGATRTRGLDAPNFTRGYFMTDIRNDAYNTEAVTINRGPNAALFGVGSPAGVVDTTLLRPNLRKDASTVAFRYGQNDANRATFDFNRVLVPRKAAFRLAALHEDEKFDQHPAFENNRRIYGAVTVQPYATTAIRLNAEAGDTVANRPISVLPFESVTDAWLATRQPFDWTYYDDPARNPIAASQQASAFEGPLVRPAGFGDSLLLVYSDPFGRAPDLGYRSQLPSTTSASVANAVLASLYQPQVNRDRAADAVRAVMTQNLAELPASYWVGSQALPGQQPNALPAGIKYQGFVDSQAFDFAHRMLDESSRQTESFRTFNVALEQRAWDDRVGVELAYDRQRHDQRSRNSFFSSANAAHIRIDATAVLPTGEPNPNVGRPYAFFGYSNWGNTFVEREAFRATGYLRYDFSELKQSWVRHLGRHSLTALFENNAADTINYATRLQTDGPAARALNPSIITNARRAIVMAYMGPSLVGNNNPLRLEPIRIPPIVAGPTVPVRFFTRAPNATDPGTFVDQPTSLVEVNNGGNAQRDIVRSQGLVLQSHWLADHLVTMVGWRRDEDFFASTPINFIANPNDPNDPGKVHYGFDDFSFPSLPPRLAAGETKSYSAVLKWPQRLLPLPAGSDVSVFYNYSGNFSPASGRVNAYNQTLPSPKGETREVGFNFSTWRDRISIRMNWFETSELGSSSNPGVFATVRQNAIFAIPGTYWAEEGNLNPQNVPFMQAALARLFAALPADYPSLYRYQVSGAAPNISATFVGLPGVTDTTDYKARGLESDVVLSPLPNWRVVLNVARQQTVQSNAYPGLKELIARLTPAWNATITDPVSGAAVPMRNIPLNGYPAGSGPASFQGGVQTYGDWLQSQIFVPYATALATEGSASAEQRKWRANVFTSYAFKRNGPLGRWLSGVTVGAGVRWQDRLGIGYPSTRNADGSVAIDIAHPYYAPADTNVDGFLAYERKLLGGRIGWKIQLNVRNLIASDTLIPITAQPWGAPATVRLPPERRWFVTNTLSF